eukprot:g17939.t1
MLEAEENYFNFYAPPFSIGAEAAELGFGKKPEKRKKAVYHQKWQRGGDERIGENGVDFQPVRGSGMGSTMDRQFSKEDQEKTKRGASEQRLASFYGQDFRCPDGYVTKPRSPGLLQALADNPNIRALDPAAETVVSLPPDPAVGSGSAKEQGETVVADKLWVDWSSLRKGLRDLESRTRWEVLLEYDLVESSRFVQTRSVREEAALEKMEKTLTKRQAEFANEFLLNSLRVLDLYELVASYADSCLLGVLTILSVLIDARLDVDDNYGALAYFWRVADAVLVATHPDILDEMNTAKPGVLLKYHVVNMSSSEKPFSKMRDKYAALLELREQAEDRIREAALTSSKMNDTGGSTSTPSQPLPSDVDLGLTSVDESRGLFSIEKRFMEWVVLEENRELLELLEASVSAEQSFRFADTRARVDLYDDVRLGQRSLWDTALALARVPRKGGPPLIAPQGKFAHYSPGSEGSYMAGPGAHLPSGLFIRYLWWPVSSRRISRAFARTMRMSRDKIPEDFAGQNAFYQTEQDTLVDEPGVRLRDAFKSPELPLLTRGAHFCKDVQWGFEVRLHHYFLSCHCRVDDPLEADFFFVPQYSACHTQVGTFNYTESSQLLRSLVPKLEFFPYSNGRDHVFVFSGGEGADGPFYPGLWKQYVPESIFIMDEPELWNYFEQWQKTPSFNFAKDILAPPQINIDELLSQQQAKLGLSDKLFVADFVGWNRRLHKALAHSNDLSEGSQEQEPKLEGPREVLLRWARGSGSASGSGDEGYNYADLHLGQDVPFGEGLFGQGASVFCFIPRGISGYTSRFVRALFANCVPVLLSDLYEIPFWPLFAKPFSANPWLLKWPMRLMEKEVQLVMAEDEDVDSSTIHTLLYSKKFTTKIGRETYFVPSLQTGKLHYYNEHMQPQRGS